LKKTFWQRLWIAIAEGMNTALGETIR
jgi:hypothetical protein